MADSKDESESGFRLALDAMGDGIWDWDLVSGEISYSDRWLESLGYQRDDSTPDLDFVADIVHPDDRSALTAAGNAHIDGHTDYFECEYRMRTRSGDYRWTLGRGRVVARDADGSALRVLGVNFDITARKSAEQMLEQVENRFSAIVETAGSAIVCVDTGFRILEWNRAAERIFGWSRAEVHGKNYVDWFVPEAVRTPVLDEIARVMAGGEGENYEAPVITRDGSERLLRWNSTSLVDPDGKIWGAVGIAQDITDQKRAEREREIAYHEMEVLMERFEELRGLLRVCSVCKKICDQDGVWSSLDQYLQRSIEVEMTHGYCPGCLEDAKALTGPPDST